jgi:hypothetical protein
MHKSQILVNFIQVSYIISCHLEMFSVNEILGYLAKDRLEKDENICSLKLKSDKIITGWE